MIDCCCEMQLSSMDELTREGLIGASMIETLHPDLEIMGFVSVSNNGSVVKVVTNKKEAIEDLRRMRPINTKEI